MTSGEGPGDPPRTPRFRVDPIPDGFLLSGAIDEAVWRLVEALIESSAFDRVVIDLREVEAMDPAAVEGLLSMARRSEPPAISLRKPRSSVRRLILELTEGGTDAIEIED